MDSGFRRNEGVEGGIMGEEDGRNLGRVTALSQRWPEPR